MEPSYDDLIDLIGKVNDLVWKMDLTMRTTYVSPACERLTGYTQQERLQQAIELQITPESYQKVITLFTDELARDRDPGVDPNRSITIELEHYHKNGTTRWFENVVSWDRSDDGTIIGVQGVSRDITERRKAEIELKESEEQHRSILETAMDGFWLTDIDENLLEVNQTYCQMSGYSRDELLTMKISDLESEKTKIDVARRMNILMLKGEDRFESKHRRKNGTVYDVEVSAQYRKRYGGRYVCFVRDITIQKQTIEDLKASNEKMKLAAYSAQFGIYNFDIRKNLLEWDDWMFRLYGVSRYNFNSEYEAWQAGIHPDDLERCSNEMNQALKGEKDFNTEFRIIRPDGKIRNIKAHGTVSCNGKGEPIKITGINYDITDKVKAETALRESEEKFRLAFHTSPDSINLNRLEDGVYLETNQGFTQVTGYTREEAVGKSSLELNVWKNPDDRRQLVDALKKKGYVENMEAEFIAKDGCTKDGLVSARFFRFNNENAIISIIRDITERKQTERALKISEARLRGIAESMADWIWEVDVNGRYIYCSEQVKEILGYTPNEMYGKTPFDFMASEEASRIQDTFKTIMDDQSAIRDLENWNIHKDGRKICLLTSGVPIFNDLDELIGYRGVDKDITERKYNEKKIIEHQKKTESIFRSAPIGIGVVSDRVITTVNNRIEEMTGYSQSELIGENAKIFYPSDKEYDYVGTEKYRQIEICGTGTVETKWKKKDGTTIDVLMRSTPIDLNDHSKGVTFTVLDISEAKADKKALLASEKKYRTMMETLQDPTYICSSDMHIEYMNPAMVKLLGNDATGQLCHKAIWGSDVQCSWCSHENIISGKSSNIEVQPPETDKLYHITSVPMYNRDGPISILTSYRDVTEVRQLLLKLQQSQKMESIGSLAGGIAHDFNNILFPIVGFAELLMEDLPSGSLERDNAEGILAAGRRAADLVNQILAFSRQQEHKLIPTRVQQVMKEVVKLTRSSIPMNISIRHDLQHNCAPIMADAVQLHQIGMNLITNAYHAVEDKDGEIAIQVREIFLDEENVKEMSIPSGKYVMISVSDNGVGIPKANLDKIFDPYFTTKPQGKGTGLGLAVVYNIIKEHKGDLQINSAVNIGTTFKIYLPLIIIEKNSESNVKKEFIEGGSEHILLIDDEGPIATLEKKILERLGYSVVISRRSIDALEIFKADPYGYDLVITDMSMPDMTGVQLAREMLKVRPDLPLIICTGFSERMDQDVAKAMGFKGFIMKPVVRSALAEEVRRVLDTSKRNEQ